MCQPKSMGGRRCPSHSDPTRIAARNAKRRDSYQAQKAQLRQEILVESSFGEAVPHAVEKSTFTNHFLNGELRGQKLSDLFTAKGQTVESKKINIKSSANEGELVEKKYFASRTVSGQVNYNELSENSYIEFGFEEISEDIDYYEDRELRSSQDDILALSKHETSGLDFKEKAAIKFFTSNDYEWFNDAIYSKGASLNPKVRNSESRDPMDQVQKEGDLIYINEDEQNVRALNSISKKLDEALTKGPKIQRVIYRGKSANSKSFKDYENVKDWIGKNAKLGQEVKFDGYQSATADMSVAARNEYSGWKAPGLIYEILTPEGINITSESNYVTEREVLLPRDSRYMVVGVHYDQTKSHLGHKAHVVQLVAINETGEVLTGDNASPKKSIWDA